MSNAKHTPGPWKYTASIPEEGFECFWIESDDEFRNAIADVRGPQDEECEANARLIAAAPELLAALIELERFTEDAGLSEIAIAAIAKAKGGAQ